MIWLVVSPPLNNISHLGWLFPIYGKIKIVPNHQLGIDDHPPVFLHIITVCTPDSGHIWAHTVLLISWYIQKQVLYSCVQTTKSVSQRNLCGYHQELGIKRHLRCHQTLSSSVAEQIPHVVEGWSGWPRLTLEVTGWFPWSICHNMPTKCPVYKWLYIHVYPLCSRYGFFTSGFGWFLG